MTNDFIIESVGKRISGDIVWSSNIGLSMRKWRETFGISQAEIARILGISQSVIADYERNKRQPGSLFIKRFVESLIQIDGRNGFKVIKELAKSFTLNFSFIIDMRDFVTPLHLQDIIVALDGVPVNSTVNNDQIYGYVITDSIKAITALNGMEFYQFLSISFNKIIVFTKVTSGRSPAIALKIAPIKPQIIVLHRPIRMDPLSIYLMDKEGITVIVSFKKNEEDIMKSLRSLGSLSES
ncbi:helix-turn-helix domain-containing protein [Acidianus brierleyi]|uniref:Transcriptional regulator n=1 Tax=Acidianus brierleyi TaxID=41673 RepID=A0A2U9IFT4_9CREN|nr:helix-turn-helix domain-containing protein [Acidianus brierleyi]AWR94870.1 helix-turn-helix domain-containing protein [Acidianus brierleyi]